MASPHVAGLAAYLLGMGAVQGGPLCDKIVELSTKDAIKGSLKGTPNVLAFNGVESEKKMLVRRW